MSLPRSLSLEVLPVLIFIAARLLKVSIRGRPGFRYLVSLVLMPGPSNQKWLDGHLTVDVDVDL